MLQIMSSSSIEPGGQKGDIDVRSDKGRDQDGSFRSAFDELNDPAARTYALEYASKRTGQPMLLNDNVIGPYAINEDGVSIDLVKGADGKPLPQAHAKMQPAFYQITVKVHRRI